MSKAHQTKTPWQRGNHHRVRSRRDVLPAGVSKKLVWYALAGSALIALPAAARADSFTVVNVNQSASNFGEVTFHLGTTTFSLNVDSEYGSEPETSYGQAYLDSNAVYNSGAGWDSSFAVSMGTSIGPGTTMEPDETTDYDELYYQEYEYTTSYSCGYKGRSTCYQTNYGYNPVNFSLTPFPNGGTGYVGFGFTDAQGDLHYGWADIYSYAGAGDASVELYSYAYDNTPGHNILAGEEVTTTPTPEPPTLAMFAAGAVGVLAFWRRRQRGTAVATVVAPAAGK